MRLSVPSDPLEQGAWLAGDTTYVALAMNLVPFSGVAFLWFVGVLRDRLGEREDQFFATVFFGSGVLLLAMLFAAAAAIGAIIIAFHAAPEAVEHSAAFRFGRGLAYGMINIYLVKAAAVFMITTSTIAIYTRLTPRWLTIGGYFIAFVLLIGSYYLDWSYTRVPAVGFVGQPVDPVGQRKSAMPERLFWVTNGLATIQIRFPFYLRDRTSGGRISVPLHS